MPEDWTGRRRRHGEFNARGAPDDRSQVATLKLWADLEEAREWLARAESLAVLTGAGISAESGVPTFPVIQ